MKPEAAFRPLKGTSIPSQHNVSRRSVSFTLEHTVPGISHTSDIKLKATKLFVLHAVSYNRDIREHKFSSHSCASWMAGWTELCAEMVNMKFTHSVVQILAGRQAGRQPDGRLAGWRHDWFQFGTAGVMRKGMVFGHEGKGLYRGRMRDE